MTYRRIRQNDAQPVSDLCPLGQVGANYERPIGSSYRYQTGISVGIVERSSQRALDGWKWVDETPGRRYLEFHAGDRLLKVLYQVLLGSHNEETQQSEDYTPPDEYDVPRRTPSETDSPQLTRDDGFIIEYPQPRDAGVQALLYNFRINSANLRDAHKRYLAGRIADFLNNGYTLRVYSLADRSFRNRSRTREHRRDYNMHLSVRRMQAVAAFLCDLNRNDPNPRFRGPEVVTCEGEVPAERSGDEEFEENEYFRGAYLEVVGPTAVQTGLIVTVIDSSIEGSRPPLEQVQVSLLIEQPDGSQTRTVPQTTGADGQATFRDLSPGRYGVAGDKDGYRPGGPRWVDVRRGEIASVQLDMNRRPGRWVRVEFRLHLQFWEIQIPVVGLRGARVEGELRMRITSTPNEFHLWRISGEMEGLTASLDLVDAPPNIFDRRQITATAALQWNADTEARWQEWSEADVSLMEATGADEELFFSVRNALPPGSESSASNIRQFFRVRDDGSMIERTVDQVRENGLPLNFTIVPEPARPDRPPRRTPLPSGLEFKVLGSKISPLSLQYDNGAHAGQGW